MRSSYIENDFGMLLRNTILTWKPVGLVELGVLDGYSTLAIGGAVKTMKDLWNIDTRLISYDLFEDYEFKHGVQEEVQKKLDDAGLHEFAELRKGDAFEAHKDFEDNRVEFLHFDLSNTGDIVRDIMYKWHPKLTPRAIVCIEGGSEDRDEVGWMKKHNKTPIKPVIDKDPLINDRYIYGTYFAYPSMTVLLKKWY